MDSKGHQRASLQPSPIPEAHDEEMGKPPASQAPPSPPLMGLGPIQESSSEFLSSPSVDDPLFGPQITSMLPPPFPPPPPPPPPPLPELPASPRAEAVTGGSEATTTTDDTFVIPPDAMLSKSKLAIRQARRKIIGVGKISKHWMPANGGGDGIGNGPDDGNGSSAPLSTTGEQQSGIDLTTSAATNTNPSGGRQSIFEASLKAYGGPALHEFAQAPPSPSPLMSPSSSPSSPLLSPAGPSLAPSAPAPSSPPGASPLPFRSTFAKLAQMAVASNANAAHVNTDTPPRRSASPSGGATRTSITYASPGVAAAAAVARRPSNILGPNALPQVPSVGSGPASRRTSVNTNVAANGNERRKSLLQTGAGGSASAPTSPTNKAASLAIKQKFTVTEEILQQIKTKNRKESQRAQAWSPRAWQRGNYSFKGSLTDTESLVNSYVELVCEDLRTSEKRKMLTRDQDGSTTWIVDPGATWRIRWDMLMLGLVIWTSYSVPYRAAFQTSRHEAEAWVDLFIDVVFCLDVVLNFFTAYYEAEGILQTNWRAIVKRYLTGWFLLDLVSSIPASGFTDHVSPALAKLFLGLKFLKLLRLLRLMRYMDSKEVALFFTPSTIRLFNTLVLLTWVWHVITCLYWFISTSEGLGSSAWTPDASYAEHADVLNYFLCFGWTVQTTFSISPYDAPESLIEAIFTILCYLVGIFMNAYVIGSAGSALQSLDQDKTEQRQLMDRIITYMKKRRLPPYFQRIILDFYNYMSAKHSEEGILTDLPPAIQLRLSLLLNRELVKNIPLLKQLELNTIIGLMQTLQSTMYMPGEHVFKVGEKGEYLYFVKNGQLEITLDNVTVISNLQKGEMFGQVALTTDGNHEFNVRAAVYSEVLSLPREAYEDLSSESEKFMELVEMEAIKQEQFIVKAQKNLQRLAKMNKVRGGEGGNTNPGGGGGGAGAGAAGQGQRRPGDGEDSPSLKEQGKNGSGGGSIRDSLKSVQKAKVATGVVGMFKQTASGSKVVPTTGA